MRLISLRSGARMDGRADYLKSEHQYLQVYRASVLIANRCLPNGSVADLIAEFTHAVPRTSIIHGLSGDGCNARTVTMHDEGDGFPVKPLRSIQYLQKAILELMLEYLRPGGLNAVRGDIVHPDPPAYQDDIAHIADVLADPTDQRTLDYVAQFLQSLAKDSKDSTLTNAAHQLARSQPQGAPGRQPGSGRAGAQEAI